MDYKDAETCAIPFTMVSPSLQMSHLQLAMRLTVNSPLPQRTVVSLTAPAWQQRSSSSQDCLGATSARIQGLLSHFPMFTLLLPVRSVHPLGRFM